MKNPTNRVLLAVFLVTALLYLFLVLCWLEVLPRPFSDPGDLGASSLWALLGTRFHGIPAFCLQLLVCRAAKRPLLRLVPLFFLGGTVALLILLLLVSSGWDALGWGLGLGLCVAPAVGFGAAWVVYALLRGLRKGS